MSDAPITVEQLGVILEVAGDGEANREDVNDLLALMRWLAQPEPECNCNLGHWPHCPMKRHREARAPYTTILRGEG